MRIEKRDNSQERRILIGMVVDVVVLARITSKWEPNLFKSSWSNLVAGWCIKYFEKYGRAPGAEIQASFERWAAKSTDKETVTLVEKFMENLSGEYEQLAKDANSDHTLDLAAEHFSKVRMSRLKDELEDDLESGDIDAAHKRVSSYNKMEMGVGEGINVLHDGLAIKAAFAEKRQSLIKYPQALGVFFGDALERDSLIAFMGPEKRGKTFWLLDMAWRAMLQGRKVAFFEVGDMSQNQIMRRFMVRAAGRPLKATGHNLDGSPKVVRYPFQMEHNPDEKFSTCEFKERAFKNDLSYRKAMEACSAVFTKKLQSKESLMKLSVHPNSTISVNGMKSTLDTWDRMGWTPDVIVCDYADILAPLAGTADSRDQINATWKGLRSLSQSLHCCVVTATQSDANSYRADTIDRTNFSEDKRKFAHATGIIGINQTNEEKAMQVMRLNWLALREGEFSDQLCVHVAGCLDVANPAVLSTF